MDPSLVLTSSMVGGEKPELMLACKAELGFSFADKATLGTITGSNVRLALEGTPLIASIFLAISKLEKFSLKPRVISKLSVSSASNC